MTRADKRKLHYARSLKSEYSDEPINTYLLRPMAGVIVKLIYPTRITPNQLTIAAIIVGVLAAVYYHFGESSTTAIAGLLVTLKDLLDSADGQLARAKNLFSRRGRFIDSIGDFLVNLLIFSAITTTLYRTQPSAVTILLGLAGLIGITLQVSYHVFYHVSYLHLQDLYQTNRLTEEIRDEDRQADPITFRLQKIFLVIYSWQDKFMYHIDKWSKWQVEQLSVGEQKRFENLWYSDRVGLRFSGFLGFGTELALLTICSLLNELQLYLWLNLILMNSIWFVTILYRKVFLAPALLRTHQAAAK